MGIMRDLAEAIIHEHTFRPLTGDVVTMGRQTVYLTPQQATDLVADHGIAIDPEEPELGICMLEALASAAWDTRSGTACIRAIW